jgi:cytochrome b6-f complex iron-sulfur subunit
MGDVGATVPGGPEGEVGRRRFLGYAWKGLAVALVVEAGWTTYDILNPRQSGAFGGIVAAGPVSDYAKDGALQYFREGRFYVTSSEGQLVALYQKCPHLGCRVQSAAGGAGFRCPCHGSTYNIRGEYLGGPAPRGMDRFRLRVQGDEVQVDTSEVIEGPPRGVSTVPAALGEQHPAESPEDPA